MRITHLEYADACQRRKHPIVMMAERRLPGYDVSTDFACFPRWLYVRHRGEPECSGWMYRIPPVFDMLEHAKRLERTDELWVLESPLYRYPARARHHSIVRGPEDGRKRS